MNILGIWDGHDAGAALLVDGRLAAAVNEERLSRRKLEVGFPSGAIASCLDVAGVRAADVACVALSTSDFAKTLSRWWPATKERYYLLRRRLRPRGRLDGLQKRAKYRITEIGSTRVTRVLSRRAVRRELGAAGLKPRSLLIFDHHACHAAAAAWASGMEPALVVTVDGVGDGASATVSVFDGGRLRRVATTSARDSLGVFFEHVTNLLNMRELEDEGKVMALADYAADVDEDDNPLLPLVTVDGLRFRGRVAGHAMHARLRDVLWSCSNERFAQMAQRTVERRVEELVVNAVRETGVRRVALAGGVASNVKANRRARLRPEVDELYVFPHMGDGAWPRGRRPWRRSVTERRPCSIWTTPGWGPNGRQKSWPAFCAAPAFRSRNRPTWRRTRRISSPPAASPSGSRGGWSTARAPSAIGACSPGPTAPRCATG